MMGKFIIIILVTCSIFSNLVFSQNNNPVIGTVNVQQREGTFLVDIYYDVTDIDNDPLIIYVQVSDDSGKTFKVPATTFTGDYGFDIIPGSNKQIVWDATVWRKLPSKVNCQ